MDSFSKEKRSIIMSKIMGKETKPEILVRKFLFSHGFRYYKNKKDLPGKPDIVLQKYRTAIFVNGCFWHGHENCKKAKLPETNREFWTEKIAKSINRDILKRQKLNEMGYKIIIIWQCELTPKVREQKLNELIQQLHLILESTTASS
jgi:DNA mismatch endonuclease (patch repair protein)